MADRAAAYEHGRARLTELIEHAGADVAERRVPACPDWTIKDLVAHLQHVTEEYSVGRHPYPSLGLPTGDDERGEDRNATNEAWADKGVAARRDRSLDQLLADWQMSAQAFYRMMTDRPALSDPADNDYLAWSAFGDFAIHYQDMHGALGLPGDRAAYCVKLGFATLPLLFVAHATTIDGVEPLRFVTARGDVVIGASADDDSVPTHEVDWFELYRAMAGRRSRAQVVTLLAPLTAERYLNAFTLYPFASESLAV